MMHNSGWNLLLNGIEDRVIVHAIVLSDSVGHILSTDATP